MYQRDFYKMYTGSRVTKASVGVDCVDLRTVWNTTFISRLGRNAMSDSVEGNGGGFDIRTVEELILRREELFCDKVADNDKLPRFGIFSCLARLPFFIVPHLRLCTAELDVRSIRRLDKFVHQGTRSVTLTAYFFGVDTSFCWVWETSAFPPDVDNVLQRPRIQLWQWSKRPQFAGVFSPVNFCINLDPIVADCINESCSCLSQVCVIFLLSTSLAHKEKLVERGAKTQIPSRYFCLSAFPSRPCRKYILRLCV